MSAWKFFHSIQRMTVAGSTRKPKPQVNIQYHLSGRTSNASVITALQYCDYQQLDSLLDSLNNPNEIAYWEDDGGAIGKDGN